GRDTAAQTPTTPSTTRIPVPTWRPGRSASPATTARSTSSTARPANSAGLSAVPNTSIARSRTGAGALSTTLLATARTGDDPGPTTPATRWPTAATTPNASTPDTARAVLLPLLVIAAHLSSEFS